MGIIEPSDIKVEFPKALKKNKPLYNEITIDSKYNSLISELQKKDDPNIIEIVWWLLSKSPLIIKALYYLITILTIKDTNMWKEKNTWIAIVSFIAVMVKIAFQFEVPAGIQESFVAFVLLLIGLTSKGSENK